MLSANSETTIAHMPFHDDTVPTVFFCTKFHGENCEHVFVDSLKSRAVTTLIYNSPIVKTP